ncbi:MAG: glycosyltransferase [candidate division Zixibacteria bacterium]|nr:glycosyltransferase [candidate division Zixibacteria bacterium]
MTNPTMDQPTPRFSISFIIPVLNGEMYMAGCLEHIRREMAPGDEIIVVDNGSTDNTKTIVARFPEVKLLTHPKATIAAVRNFGAKSAKGNLLAFIDCDCLVCPGWRRAAIDVLRDDTIAATGSHLDLPDNPTWVEAAWILARNTVASPAGYIPSGNFVVRSAAFRAVSGFDETMITDEDTDIGMRLCRQGFGIINAPGVRAIHLGNPKTIAQFVTKEKWHSTSIVKNVTWRTMDKPMVMTLAFLALFVGALACMPAVVLGTIGVLVPVTLILIVPLVTVLYRLYQFGKFKYVVHQIILYLLFYSVRSMTVLEHFFRKRNRVRP